MENRIAADATRQQMRARERERKRECEEDERRPGRETGQRGGIPSKASLLPIPGLRTLVVDLTRGELVLGCITATVAAHCRDDSQ